MRRRLGCALAAWLVLLCGARAEYLTVHVGYVVPQGRTEQPAAAANMWQAMELAQAWYAEQMDRWGFGPRTFRLDSAGATHVVHSTDTAETIRADIWPGNINAAQGAGLPIWSSGNVWFLASNSQQMHADGSIDGGTALGGSNGNTDDAGVAMIGGDVLNFLAFDGLRDNTPYAGQVFSEVGPYPFVQDVSRPWFEGSTVSSVSSSIVGALTHELGHAFGLPHTPLNDNNFDGDLMGNGLRGMRGVFAPDQYSADDTWLSYGAALALSTSRYFDPDATYTDNSKPSLTVSTSGVTNLVDGQLSVSFTAADGNGLSAAVLLRNGEAVAALDLKGSRRATTNIVTPYFDEGVAADFELKIYDRQGNLQRQTVNITPQANGNIAPKPFVRTNKTNFAAGELITLDAGGTTDPDNSGTLLVEWDFDGDGIFDTAPSRHLSTTTRYNVPGTWQVVARITDGAGTTALSSPIPLRSRSVAGDYNSDGLVDLADYDAWRQAFGSFAVPYFGADGNGDAVVNLADYVVWRDNLGAALPAASLATAAVPEPGSSRLALLAVGMGVLFAVGRRRA